jgi:hypothetical protein
MRTTAGDVERALTSLSSGVSSVLKQNADEVERTLLGVSSEVARNFVGRADEIAAAVGKRSAELTKILDEKSSGLLAAIASKTDEFTSEVGRVTDTAVHSIQATGFAFTGTMMDNSSELARVINDAGTNATEAVNRSMRQLQQTAETAISHSTGTITQSMRELQHIAETTVNESTGAITRSVDESTGAFTRSITESTDAITRSVTDSTGAITRSVTESSTTITRTVQELHDKTQGVVEHSRQTATVTVAEMLETHGMLRSDTAALFERLREANGLLQEVLSGAQDNLSSIEHMLSSRVTEFVSTMNQLLERTGDTTHKMDDHIGSFYGLTTKVLRDLTELATQFDTHGRSLAQAVELVELSNRRADDTLGARRAAIESVVGALDTRTEDLDSRLKRFSGLLEESLAAAEARARDIARVVADSTAEGTRAIAEQHEAVRMTSEQERVRTADALRALYEQATNDAHMLFRDNAGDSQNMLQEAKDRFVEIVTGVKQMAAEMQRELDSTRQELRRGILELPQETAESASQMRRVIVDQIEALAELNRIVARHGRGMDAQQAEPVRRAQPEESVVVSMGGRGPRQVARADITGAPGPMPSNPPPTAFAPRRAESPSLSPAQGPGFGPGPGGPGPSPSGYAPGPGQGPGPGPAPGNRGGGWLTDLLSRASREPEAPRGDERPRADERPPMRPDDRPRADERPRNDDRQARPDDRASRHTIESLDSLSVDIARMIDHNAATELWDRYNRGERNVFSKRLYTMQGQKAFDEISKRYRADREFKQTVDRYIGEFERLLEEVSRDDRGQVVARTYLTSETGKVYTMLAHAAGRFE